MCTTLSKEGNLSGNLQCGVLDPEDKENKTIVEGSVWHSCEEWCLSKVNCFIRRKYFKSLNI